LDLYEGFEFFGGLFFFVWPSRSRRMSAAAASGKLKGGALPVKATFTIAGLNLTFHVDGEVDAG